MRLTTIRLSDAYRKPIHAALIEQAVSAVVCLLLLDFGRMARILGVTVVGFWVAVAIVMARRPDSPTREDLAWIRWGFPPTLVLTIFLAILLGR